MSEDKISYYFMNALALDILSIRRERPCCIAAGTRSPLLQVAGHHTVSVDEVVTGG